jgi:hypothetical protein
MQVGHSTRPRSAHVSPTPRRQFRSADSDHRREETRTVGAPNDDENAGPNNGSSSTSSVSRRTMLGTLGALGAGGAALAIAACSNSATTASLATNATMPGGTPATTPPTTAPPAGSSAPPLQLLADPGMNYDALTVLGAAPYGLSEVGEVVTMVNTINRAGATIQNYFDTFLAWGDMLAVRAAKASDDDNIEGAMLDSLRAATYYESALFFVLGTTAAATEEQVYEKFRASWETAAPSLAPRAEKIAIPYEGRTMPGWFFAPDRSGKKRPTLIVNNGSDGQSTWVWGFGAAAGLDYGWNTVIFDGPGQGSMLFVDNIPFRYDWENVITPVVDFLSKRSDVDPRRIALIGGSMAGELVPRAAIFEHRLAGVIAAPGVVNPWLAFPPILREIVTPDKATTNATWVNDIIANMDPEQTFTMKKRLECYDPAAMADARQGRVTPDFWTPVQTLQKQDITTDASRITSPTLVIDYEDEQFYPGQADQLHGLLTCPKDLVRMTSAEGAQMHCSPMAPQYHNDVVFNWLNNTVT